MSVAMTAHGNSRASATARQPRPVPTSATRGLADGGPRALSASSTISSVSGRGMSTSGVTAKARPQNSRRPRMYATGSRALRRRPRQSGREAGRRRCRSRGEEARDPSRARAGEHFRVDRGIVGRDPAARAIARGRRRRERHHAVVLGRVLQLLGVVEGRGGVDQLVEVAVEPSSSWCVVKLMR